MREFFAIKFEYNMSTYLEKTSEFSSILYECETCKTYATVFHKHALPNKKSKQDLHVFTSIQFSGSYVLFLVKIFPKNA